MPTVEAAAREIRTGQRSARELVEHCLARIEATEPTLNAWCHLDPDGARRLAAAVDDEVAHGRAHLLGPLAGVPFGVKDLEDCAGMPTTRGSRWFADRGPMARDDLHVERLRSAGAIALGKTTAPEFGAWGYTQSPLLGVTRNPWDPSRTPGGSSGGSAAAIAAGAVPFATASDGGGSIRGPGASCGLPGLKAVYGRVPTYGVTRLAQNAVNGALATTVADTALLYDVMAGPDRRDRTSMPAPPASYREAIDTLEVAGIRAAWSADLGFAVVDPEVRERCAAAATGLIAAAHLSEAALEPVLDDYIGIYVRVELADQFVGIDPVLWTERLDELDPRVRDGWRRAANVSVARFAGAEADRRALELTVAGWFDEIDVLLTPTNTCPPFAAEGPMPTEIGGVACHGGMAAVLTMLANLCNLPSITVPAGLTADGLPIGLMITAPQHREDLCLRLARIWEQASPWPRHAPLP